MRPLPCQRARGSSALAFAAAFVASLALAGCGHPATRDECGELFAKSAEIELKAQPNNDPKRIEEQIQAAKSGHEGEEFMNRCVGRRITARAMQCVRAATTAEQVDRCL